MPELLSEPKKFVPRKSTPLYFSTSLNTNVKLTAVAINNILEAKRLRAKPERSYAEDTGVYFQRKTFRLDFMYAVVQNNLGTTCAERGKLWEELIKKPVPSLKKLLEKMPETSFGVPKAPKERHR